MQRRDWGAKNKRLQIGVCLVFVLCPIGCSPGSPAQCLPSSNIFAFLHVNIIPMNREVVLADQTLIVCDGQIAAEHDELFAGPDGKGEADVSDEDRRALEALHWHWNERYDCWRRFT